MWCAEISDFHRKSERERERERESNNYLYDVIYIDPPYNTEHAAKDGNGVADDKENKENKKFIYRDKFSRNGWLNMMQERLVLARKLLKEDGVIFVSIDDNEQAYLKVLMDDVFGEENFVANITWIKKVGPGSNTSTIHKIVSNCEYILVYSKNLTISNFNYKKHDQEKLKKLGYTNKDKYFEERGAYKLTDLFRPSSSGSFKYQESLDYPIKAPDGSDFYLHVNLIKPKSGCYTWSKDTFDKGNELGFIEIKKNNSGYWQAYRKQYQYVKFSPKDEKIIYEVAGQDYENYIDEKIFSQKGGSEMIEIFSDKNIFAFPKPVDLIKYLLNICANKNARVLDFFAGSGTTAHAVMQLNCEDGGNRTFTLVTNNENNIGYGITYERLYRITQGKGTNNETFKWLDENKPYDIGFDLYDVQQIDLSISSKNNIKEFESNVVKMLKNFGLEKPEEIELIKLRALKSLSNN
ncbi:site-specific DNA-methyltransferase [Mycoplasma bradburyae]|uniref:site-specific DNA-methyltransferase n=1 Tax=Mycoplasma bradburyae TaxID=2963128 RepID=UPI002AC35C7D|nr:site-specific DNA-methyltransferase [Mycoplasma bradburyae]